MAKRTRNLTQGNIPRQLFDLAWPMLFGMMGMVVFNLVDTYFVGKLGVRQLAAMTFTFPVVMFVSSLSMGIGIGTSSLISRNIIHAKHEKVKMISGRALLLGMIVVVLFAAAGIITIRPVFSMIGAKSAVLGYVSDYMFIWYMGVPFVVLPMIGNNIIRATGDTFTPGMIMVAIAMVNVILDPLLIFGIGPFPEMGIKGAAIATVFARASGFVIVSYILIKKADLLSFRLGSLKDIFSTWEKVLYIGVPASLTMLINPLSLVFITKILAGFGKETVAAFGVARRVERFALMFISSLGSVLIIFMGQNFSRHKYKRIFKALSLSSGFSMLWGLVVFILLLFFGRQIVSSFTDNAEVIKTATKYFYIIGASYGFQGLVMLSTSGFNGINKPHPSAFFSISRMLLLYVPLAWIGARLFNINGVFFAGFIANIIIGPASYIYLRRTVKKLKLKHAPDKPQEPVPPPIDL